MIPARRERRASQTARLMRLVRKAEADAIEQARKTVKGEVMDVGTGQTILKMLERPLPKLHEGKKIGGPEVMAAQEIAQAVSAIGSGGRLSGISFDRVDAGRGMEGSDWPARLAKIVKNYQSWANHWAKERNRTGNPMLKVMYAAIIEETPFNDIAAEVNYGRRRVEQAVICGLRHYAAWSGYVSGRQATAWLVAAEDVFSRRREKSLNSPTRVCY
jgi:hypothetical protein